VRQNGFATATSGSWCRRGSGGWDQTKTCKQPSVIVIADKFSYTRRGFRARRLIPGATVRNMNRLETGSIVENYLNILAQIEAKQRRFGGGIMQRGRVVAVHGDKPLHRAGPVAVHSTPLRWSVVRYHSRGVLVWGREDGLACRKKPHRCESFHRGRCHLRAGRRIPVVKWRTVLGIGRNGAVIGG